ncbi:MAG: hypothetical protein HFE28_07610 [Clostridia bacterium]|nr:hypothetical protein [Clostridia bacterium]
MARAVRREAIRYYDIPPIFRAWEAADGEPDHENTTTEGELVIPNARA